MARGPARSGRRAPLWLEALEPRMLLTGAAAPSTSIQLPPALFAASLPDVPVPFNLPGADSPLTAVVLPPGATSQDGVLQPGGGIDLDQISVGAATGTLGLELTWDTLPQGASGQLSVFDDTGNLLVDSSTAAGSNSSVVALDAPTLIPGEVLYVGVQMSEPGGAGGASVPGASYQLQIATGTGPDSLVVSGAGTSSFGSSSSTCSVTVSTSGVSSSAAGGAGSPTGSVTTTTTGNVSARSGGAQGPPAPNGAGSPGLGPSIINSGGGAAPGRSTSWVPIAGTAAVGTGGTETTERATPGLSTPIDVGPLPASPYEPAGGIFRVDGSAASVDRVEGTRVEMSLVRIVSPGREESLEGVWASDQNPNNPPVDTVSDSPRDIIIRVGSTSSDRSGLSDPRPSRRIADGAVPPTPEYPGAEVTWLVSAVLPPIDERDRPVTSATSVPRGDASWTGRVVDSWDSPGRAIALGLSGSAVLGATLYAPNLAAAFHRAVPRPVRRRR